ncbi:MAG: hypothetical protein F6K31_00730 [Symploca sp. SIO2G7]|nr:hypothetical protein [Symploca sp. SIO2G7]
MEKLKEKRKIVVPLPQLPQLSQLPQLPQLPIPHSQFPIPNSPTNVSERIKLKLLRVCYRIIVISCILLVSL